MATNYTTKNENETLILGEAFAKNLKNSDTVALYGDLGAGKTVFVKGIAKGLGIAEEVVSPTFTILKEYCGDKKLYHFDLYRIEDEEELEHIGFYEYLGGDGICVIEWAQNAPCIHNNIEVKFSGSGSDTRTIEIKGIQL